MDFIIPKCFNIYEFSDFIPYKLLQSEILKLKNNQEACKYLHINMSFREIFIWGYSHGFEQIVTFIYITKNIPYLLTDINKINLFSKISSSVNNFSIGVSAPIISGGSNTSLKIEVLDKESIDIKKITDFLYKMRKYSTYSYHKKYNCYGWIFNKKYINKFMN